MPTLSRTRLRFAADAASFDAPLDVLRRATPQFWRGNDVQFELALFFNGALLDVSNLASLTLEIRPLGANGSAPDPSFAPLMGATITSFDNTANLGEWNSGAKQHALVVFTAAQSNIAAGAAWLSIFAITRDSPGRVITLCAGPVRVLEDGAGLATTPTPTADTFYTAAESDARFAPVGAGSGAAADDTNPSINGTAAPGTSLTYSRGDHVHPTDSSRAPLASPALTGAPTAPTVSSADDSSTKIATTAFVQSAIAAADGSGGGAWGSITGTLASQADLQSALNLKAPLASPAFSGAPTAPTVSSAADNSTKIATTAFVQAALAAASSDDVAWGSITGTLADQADLQSALDLKATLVSPSFSGTPGAPTAAVDTNTTQLATTAFVLAQASSSADGSPAMDGTTTRGTSTHFARADHIHPTDTSRAPVASPTFTGSPTAPTVSTATDSSTKIATTAFVQAALAAYTAPIANDGSGHYWFGGSAPMLIGVASGGSSYNATLSVTGGLAADSALGEHMFVNSYDPSASGHDSVGTHGNVLSIWAKNGACSGVRFLRPTDGYEVGAVGFCPLPNGNVPVNVAFLSGSVPYNPSTGSATDFGTPTTAGVVGLQQEGYFVQNSSNQGLRIREAWFAQSDWSVSMQDPFGATCAIFNAPGGSPSYHELKIIGTRAYRDSGSGNSGSYHAGAQFTAQNSTGSVSIFAINQDNESWHAYPADGTWMGGTGPGGVAIIANHASGIIKFLSGGDQNSNEWLRISAAGSFVASNVVTSAPAATLANSQYEFCVYDNAGTATFRVRYKNASGTVKVGDLALT